MYRIGIMGNSVSLFIRPPREKPEERTYAEILEHEVPARVVNLSQRATMVSDGLRNLERAMLVHNPQLVILQYGIVECTYRTLPRWLYMLVKHRLQGDESRLERLPVQLAARLLVPLSRMWARMHGPWRWLEPAVFIADLERIIALLRKETAAHMLLMNIPAPSKRVERLAPGTVASARVYNAALARLAKSAQLPLIDAERLTQQQPELLPDGIHFNAEGHRRIADLILQFVDCSDQERILLGSAGGEAPPVFPSRRGERKGG